MGKLFGAVSGATLGMIGLFMINPLAGTAATVGSLVAGGLTGMAISDLDKEEGFKDGISKANDIANDKMNKHFVDFILATTALSYYVARCDGKISEEEKLEIAMDLDAILKNQSIPDAVFNEMDKLSKMQLTFATVQTYLDRVPLATVEKLQQDVEELIRADGKITREEEFARDKFKNYLASRKAKGE